MKPFLLSLLLISALNAQNTAIFPGATVTPAQIGVASNQTQTTLTMGVGSTDTSLNVASTSGFKAGSFVSADNEIMAVCAIADGTHLTLGVSACPNVDGRGTDTANGGGAAASHLASASVQARIVASHINQLAAEVIALETQAATPATAAGGQASALMSVSGTLAIGSDLAPWVFLATTRSATAVQVQLKHPPTGAALTCVIYVNGTSWMTLTIAAGTSSVSATSGQVAAAAAVTAGAPMRLDITATGSTYPGGDISAMVFF